MPPSASGRLCSLGFPRTAIPVFWDRVSPVLDACTQLIIIETDRKRQIVRRTVPVKGNSIYERTREIKKLKIEVIICGAVSDAFFNLLKTSHIHLVCGISGDVEEVTEAYRRGTLTNMRFRMPGFESPGV
ncbi:MAG: NifB/NifX family molybdenum-iron cluster-binding protein [Desulfobacterales bacterium]